MRSKYGIEFIDVGFNRIHNQPHELKKIFKELRGCTPVCLARNPWARCLSLYIFNIEAAVRPKNIDQKWSETVHCRLIREGFKGTWISEEL